MTYVSEVLADSPVAYYRLGEPSGATMSDSSGNGRDGVYNNGPTLGASGLVLGDTDTACTFNGTSQYGVVTPHATWMDLGAALTVEAIIVPTNVSAFREIVSVGDSFRIRVSSSAKVQLLVNTGSLLTLNGATTLVNGTKYHIVATYDGTTARLYVNNVLDGSNAKTGSITVTTNPFTVARLASSSSEFFAGTIDEAAVYGTALSSTRVGVHYTAMSTAGSYAGTAAKSVTISTSSAGKLGLASSAAKALTVATASAGTRGKLGAATRTVTISSASAGKLGLTGAAAKALTVSTASAGARGKLGAAAAVLAIAATSAGVVAHGAAGSAARSVTVSTVSAGKLGLGGSASKALILSTAAAGVRGVTGAATAPLTLSTTSAGVVSSGGPVIHTRRAWDGGILVDFQTTGGDFDPPVDPGPVTTAPSYAVVAALVVDSVNTSGVRVVPSVRMVTRPRTGYRILVGGKDVTWYRGVKTPLPTYSLISPLRYGSGSLSFPQINGALERPGHGALAWLQKFATVRVQRLADDGHVVDGGERDYVGFVSDFPPSGRDLTITLGGQASGLAAMQDRPAPIFAQTNDIGGQVMRTIQHALRLPIANSPTTGIEIPETGGTGSHLDWLTDVLAKSTEVDGTQWTVGLDTNGAYRMHLKDTETIDATVYVDGFRVVESLKRDFTEEPNRVWAQGIDADGKRQRFAIFPGLAQASRPSFPGSLSPGDSGDGVTALIWRLFTVGYLDEPPFGMDWTTSSGDPVTDAVKDLQDDAGLSRTGTVNSATWSALFDPDVTGFSLTRSSIKPAAQRSYTQAFLRNASGQIIGPNPNYDRTRPLVDVSVDMGTGWTRRRMQRWAQHELADASAANWVGTLTVTTGAVIDGEHNPGDPLGPSDLRDVRSLKPGDNLWLANWDGGTLVHLSGVNVTPDSVELTVDTRARDTMKVWEVIARNRESRRNASRQWIAQNRRSGMRDDSGSFYDGGTFGRVQRTFLPGNQWTVIPVPAGRSGQLGKVDISVSDDQALFVVAAFGLKITPAKLAALIGDPTTVAGTKNWTDQQKTLVDDRWLVWSYGGKDATETPGQFCGYWPKHVTADGTTPAVTGDFRDNAGVAYFCKGAPVLWVAFYPDRDCHLQGGRIFELQLDDAAG